MSNQQGIVRYSNSALEEFKAIIEKKLTKAQRDLKELQEQILEITENTSDEFGGDWMDDSSTHNDLEFLNSMAIRQRKYIQELSNALVRIQNKTYGVCVVTGTLIDKRRLLAVPTTTKSLEAKQGASKPATTKEEEPEEEEPKAKKKAPAERTVLTRIVRKSTATTPTSKAVIDEDDYFEEENMDYKSVPSFDDLIEEEGGVDFSGEEE